MKLVFDKRFPFYCKTKYLRNKAILGIGGNIGKTILIFKKLLLYLKSNPSISLHKTSPLLINPAFGYTKQKDFHNGLLFVSTNMQAKYLLSYILRIEKRLGRTRDFKNAPRTIDIDIIEFGNKKINTDNLIIPHPLYKERKSVIIPMSFLNVPLRKINSIHRSN